MKNRHGTVVLGVVCAGVLGSSTLYAEPPVKLFESSDDEAPGEITIVGSKKKSVTGIAQVEAAEDARAITPTVMVTGASMWVEATVQGREVLFLVDTGASYTTLTPWFAKLIGASPGAGAPTSSFQTAGGLQEMPFGVMPSLAFGGVTHKHVTFSLCESCGDADSSKRERPVVGLLGMNVLGRYKMNMDGEALTLFKSTRHQNRRADILPWVTLEAFEPGKRDGEEWPVSVKIKNHSARKFKRATAQVQCLTADQVVAWDVKLDGLKGGRSASETLMMKVSPKQCRQLDINVLDATW